MNYRGAKVNITGHVSAEELHSAWIQLQQLKLRGQQYFKGRNCRIISAGFGDIINITGKKIKKVKEKEVIKVEKLKEPVTAYVFVYDESSGSIIGEETYTGFNFVAGIQEVVRGGVYNGVRDFVEPLKIAIKVHGSALQAIPESDIGHLIGTMQNFPLSGPQSYTVTLGGSSAVVDTSYYIGSFLIPKSMLVKLPMTLDDHIAGSKFYPGETCGSISESSGGSMRYPFDVSISAEEYIAEAPCVYGTEYLGDWSILDDLGVQKEVPREYCTDLQSTCVTEDPNYMSVLIPADTGYVANRFYNFTIDGDVLVPDVEVSPGVYTCVCPGVTVTITTVEFEDCFPGFRWDYSINYLCGHWYSDAVRIGFPTTWVYLKTFPELGTPGIYTSEVHYYGITELDDKVLKVFAQGIPNAYKPQVSGGIINTIYLSVNDEIICAKVMGYFEAIVFRNAAIYKIEDNYVYIVSYSVSANSHYHIVVREKKDGTYEDISAGYDSRYPYLRIAKFQYLLKGKINGYLY